MSTIYARTTDPDTSHEAAESLKPTPVKTHIMHLLKHYGSMTDGQLEQTYHLDAHAYGWIEVTPQRIRTARAELVKAGRVKATGELKLTRYGRKTQTWTVA